jgi:inorganic pyrophosphatase
MGDTRTQAIANPAGGPPLVWVTIEIPRWSFLKRGSTGQLDFVSPLPCPYNYGSVPGWLGLEGDLLDALVLGPRLPRGAQVQVYVYGAMGLADRGLYDDKLICALAPPTAAQRARVLAFFRLYGRCKAILNLLRRRPGWTACVGWCPADEAIARARPVPTGGWPGPEVPF